MAGWRSQHDDLGALVRVRRGTAGLTQRELADMARVSVGTLRDLEQGRTRHPRAGSVERLARVLGLDLAVVRQLTGDVPESTGQAAAEPGRAGWRVHGLWLSILGPLEAWRDGVPVLLGEPKQRAVLALLALSPNTFIRRELLIDGVWEENPPETAVQLVQGYVSRLRHILDPGRPPRDPRGLLVSEGACYRLHVAEDQLDLLVFGRLADRARAAASGGELSAACDVFEQALGLWRAEPLADMAALSGHPAVTQLSAAHAAAVMEYAEVTAHAGSPERALSWLRELTAREPLDEKAHALLMTALAASGQQAMALQIYEDLRHRLDDELGVRPARELSAALQRVLRQEVSAPAAGEGPGIGGPAEQAVSGLKTQAAAPPLVPRQLPAAVRHFVGRRTELESLTALLDQAGRPTGPVVISAIGGTAGVGKTALAVHWAHQVSEKFPDGQLYVNLRGFDPAQPVPAAEALAGLLRAMGVAGQDIPPMEAEQAAQYRSLLAGRRMLVVLDNARDAVQVRPLLPGSPGCLVLVTSRSQLAGLAAIEGAHLLTLDLLTEAEARQLLEARLGAEPVSAEPAAADELIGLCARLPLALAIAAARASAHPSVRLGVLVKELTDAQRKLDVLETGDTAASVRAVFSWSLDSLPAPPSAMFALLGLHPGPDITIPAAASLARLPLPQARLALRELAQAHLVTEPAPGRYALHDLLRAYAAEQATAAYGPAARRAAQTRALDHYLHTASSAARLLEPSREAVALAPPRPGVTPEQLADYRQAMAWFEAEHQVLRGAVTLASRAGFDACAWQLPWALDDYLNWRGHWHEWAANGHTALAAATRRADTAGQAVARRLLAHACASLGDYDQARDHLTECLSLCQRLGDRVGQARAHRSLGVVAERQDRHADGLVHDEQALALYQAVGDRAGQAGALNNVGHSHARLGDYWRAQAFCRQAVDLYRQLGHRHGEAGSWDSLGYAEHQLGHLTDAADCYRRALGILRDLGDRYSEALILTHLGDVRHTAGDLPEARASWQQALVILDDLHHADAGPVRAKLHQSGTARRQRSSEAEHGRVDQTY